MERFIVFFHPVYDAAGGWNDSLGIFDNTKAAMDAIQAQINELELSLSDLIESEYIACIVSTASGKPVALINTVDWQEVGE